MIKMVMKSGVLKLLLLMSQSSTAYFKETDKLGPCPYKVDVACFICLDDIIPSLVADLYLEWRQAANRNYPLMIFCNVVHQKKLDCSVFVLDLLNIGLVYRLTAVLLCNMGIDHSRVHIRMAELLL